MLAINVHDTWWQGLHTIWAVGMATRMSSVDEAWLPDACCWSHVCEGQHVQLGERRTEGGGYRLNPVEQKWGERRGQRERSIIMHAQDCVHEYS